MLTHIERHFGRTFEQFYRDTDRLVTLLREAIPSVLKLQRAWDDVANVTTELGIDPQCQDEFISLWESEFGTRSFQAILREPPGPAPPDPEAESDEPGHGTGSQPETSAKYPRSAARLRGAPVEVCPYSSA